MLTGDFPRRCHVTLFPSQQRCAKPCAQEVHLIPAVNATLPTTPCHHHRRTESAAASARPARLSARGPRRKPQAPSSDLRASTKNYVEDRPEPGDADRRQKCSTLAHITRFDTITSKSPPWLRKRAVFNCSVATRALRKTAGRDSSTGSARTERNGWSDHFSHNENRAPAVDRHRGSPVTWAIRERY